MSEEIERSSEQTGDPVAVSLALAGASREKADAFLDNQNALIADQRQHLHEQLKQIHLDVWEKRMGVLLRVATAAVGLAVAAGLGYMVGTAARSNALIFDAFSVPPDMAAKGLTGEVLAGDLADRLTAMSRRFAYIGRPNQSYTNNFGSGIKLEIPETGVSLGELDRFLREQLGHDTHVSGALVHTESGLRLSVRTGDLGGDSTEGAQGDLDALTQRMAEAIYGRTQPIRYGIYLYDLGRYTESRAVFEAQTRSELTPERAAAFYWLGSVPDQPITDGLRLHEKAAATDPGGYAGNAAPDKFILGRYEAFLADIKVWMERQDNAGRGGLFADRISLVRLLRQSDLDVALGDYRDAAEKYAAVLETNRINPSNAAATLGQRQALDHDPEQAKASLATYRPIAPGRVVLDKLDIAKARIQVSTTNEDWPGVLREATAMESLLAGFPSRRMEYHLGTELEVAIAEARLGQFGAAEGRVRDTPGDCYPCLVARAQIAELRGQHDRADWWFVRAEGEGPLIPFASYEWAKALLARGKPDDAIAQFTLANQKGPHFADALEGWGEALMAKNQSHMALAKFADANKYAPNWGRLHLKWGEALYYTGRKDEARAQFARAAQLDLTPSEQTELAKAAAHG
jgi:tetratricopeptide (TPR) repeat protein